MKVNKVYNVDCRVGLKQMISEGMTVHCIGTSPPYYGLRDYDIDPIIWDGDHECKHEWGNETKKELKLTTGANSQCVRPYREEASKKEVPNGQFCIKCSAWYGQLGLEPSINLYISHLCNIFDLAKEVLVDYGSLWVNLGDCYGTDKSNESKLGKKHNNAVQKRKPIKGYEKCLLMIPQRFAIEMTNRGWILRNVIIWKKNNSLPESAKDRFTNDFEYIFFFVKNNKRLYWVNRKTLALVDKKPKGIHGIENKDWYWEYCSKCKGKGKIIKIKKEKPNPLLNFQKKPKINEKKEIDCKRCKGTGKVKKTYWRSRDYYFEQQFEKSTTEFIYSRNSKKGDIQDKNNPRTNWGLTKEELDEYNSKYKESEYGQTLQGFFRNNSIKKERDLSRIQAKELFPNDKKKQKEYIQYIHDHGFAMPYGRNKRCIWTINTIPHKESHFAIFPDELIENIIKAGCPEFVCKKCGMPREKIFNKFSPKEYDLPPANRKLPYQQSIGINVSGGGTKYTEWKRNHPDKFLGYSKCICDSSFTPGVICDPFVGIGTTLKVAFKLGRNGIGFEIGKKYAQISNEYLSKNCSFKRLTEFMNENKIKKGEIIGF